MNRVALVVTVLGGLGAVATALVGLGGWATPHETLVIAAVATVVVTWIGGWALLLGPASRRGDLWKGSGATIIMGGLLPAVDALYGVVDDPVYYVTGVIAGLSVVALAARTLYPLMRERLFEFQWYRSVSETVMIGVALLAFWWNVMIRDVSSSPFHPMVALTAMGCVVAALFLVATAREADSWLRVATAGATGIAGIDGWGLWQLMEGDPPWLSRSIGCLFWVMVVVGLLRGRPVTTNSQEEARLDGRRLMVVGVATVLIVALALAGILANPPLDTFTIFLIGVYLVAMLAREIVRARQINQLTVQVLWKASHDQLTGLANRRALEEWSASSDLPERFSLLSLDLDGFKAINDNRGHSVGDSVLVEVGFGLQRLSEGEQWRIFRLGGDEFLLLCLTSPEEAERKAWDVVAMVQRVAAAFPSLGEVTLTASIGVRHLTRRSTGDDVGSDWLRVGVAEAGSAMLHAKQRGKNRVVVYDQSLSSAARRRAEVMSSLRKAVLWDAAPMSESAAPALRVVLEPVVRAGDWHTVVVEAVPVLEHGTYGLIRGRELTPVAVEAGLGAQVFLQTLELALHETAGARAEGALLGMSVSTAQLTTAGFAEDVLDLLARFDVDPMTLVLGFAADPGTHGLRRLAESGVQLVLEGVGGPGQVSELAHLSVRGVRVSPSVTRTLRPREAEAVLTGIVEMCRKLDIVVLMSDVDTSTRLEIAHKVGVGYLQGAAVGARTRINRPRGEDATPRQR